MPPQFPIDCDDLPELISTELIIYANEIVTELGEGTEMNPGRLSVLMDEIELNQPEDHHEVLNLGTIETLVEQILPRQCAERNDALWLSAVIMYEIARGQPFVNGNKRTATLTANQFLVDAQLELMGKEAAIYFPITDKLIMDVAAAARGELGRGDVYELLQDALEDREF